MIPPKRVLLIVGGGVAAYKGLEVIRALRRRGALVRCILTKGAQQFVTPLSAASLSGDKAYTDLFSLTDEAEMGHIELSRDADLVLVAPATASLLARMAGGQADDLATTALLATDKRVLVAPAMNVRMWLHPATVRNVARLTGDGVAFIGPDSGDMACGEHGPGRLAEPEAIAAAALALLAGDTRLPLPDGLTLAGEASAPGPLTGRHVLVTSGPTHEPIDPVRYLANRSSGRQGHAIAAAAAALGARVTLVSGPVALPDPAGVTTIRVETAIQMQAEVEAALPADAAIMVAAVADWRAEAPADQKLKKGAGGPPALSLVPNPDILAGLARRGAGRPALVIGFAAETERVLEHALKKRAAKGCDWLVANDVGAGSEVAGGVMGAADNRVRLLTEAGVEEWPVMGKEAVARRLMERVAAHLGTAS